MGNKARSNSSSQTQDSAKTAAGASTASATNAADASRDTVSIEPIAYIRTQFATKFGVPRQSGIIDSLTATVVFEPKYRNADALRGIEGFSHLWLVWGFHQARRDDGSWTPLVRPPRLGGNDKVGVFACRSPFRPNNLGLSAVRLDNVEQTPQHGSVLHVRGADLVDGTPIYDIKPYIPYTDSITQASGGFASSGAPQKLEVHCPDQVLGMLGDATAALQDVLACDPRPAFHHDPDRIYGMDFAGFNIKFKVDSAVEVLEATRL